MFCVAGRGDIPTRDTPASKENAKSSKRYIERKWTRKNKREMEFRQRQTRTEYLGLFAPDLCSNQALNLSGSDPW